MKNKIINKLNYIIIDSLLFKNKNNIKYLIRMLENSKINLNKVNLLILDYKKNYINYDLLTAFFNSLNIAVVEIDNKKSYQHINQIFNFVKKINSELVIKTIKDKIKVSKQILYLASRTSKYIYKETNIGGCPNHLESNFCNFCLHNCSYCELNRKFSNRPIYTIFCDFDKIEKSFKLLNKNNNNDIVNTSSFCEVGDINTIFPEYWNIISELAYKHKQALLFLTKTMDIDTIQTVTRQTKNNIYGFSMNTENGIAIMEKDTMNYRERIYNLKKIRDKGYRVVVKFEPIFIRDLYESFFINNSTTTFFDININDCYKVIDDIQTIGIEAIGLGLLRGFLNMQKYSDIKYPDNYKEIFDVEKNFSNNIIIKYPLKIRTKIYNEILSYITEIKNKRICKEPYIEVSKLEKGKYICKLEKSGELIWK